MGDRNLKQNDGGDGCCDALDASADGIAVLDDGEYVYVNDRYVGIHGYEDSEELLGTEWGAAYTDEDTERLDTDIVPTVREKGEWRGEVTGLSGDGTEFPKEITVSLMEEGGFVCVARDITERKERERELERYEAFVENSSDSITHMDEDGEILYRSPSSEREEDEPEDMSGTYAFEHIHPDDRERAFEKFRSLLDDPDRDTDSVEYRSERADGTYEWVEGVATDQRDTEVGGVVVNTRVIEERKKRQNELERYETFVENSSDIIVHLDVDGTVIYYSPSAERIMGHGSEERIGDNAFEYVHPEDTERVMELFESTVGKDVERAEAKFRAQDADGEYVWLEAVGTDQRDTEIGGLIVNIRDITERKERERELERYETFVKSSADVITHIDEDGTIMYNSPSIKDVFGYGQEENVGDNAFEYVHPDDRERMVEIFAESLEGTNEREENAEFRVLNADGEYVWVEDAAGNQTHPRIEGDVLNLREITDRKEREKELREEKNRHRALVDGFPNGAVFLFDENLRFNIAGGTELDNVELSPEDIEGRTLHEVFPEETVEKHEPYYRKALEGEEACFENTYEDNVYRVWTVPVRNDEGEIFSGIAFSQNITERKERERELERYEAIVKNTSDVITLIDEDGTILYQSPSVERRMGYGQQSRVGENGFDYVHPDDRERALEGFRKVVEEPETDTVETELRFERADGSYVWLEARGTDQRDTEVGGFVVTTRNISERKEREKELRRNRELLRQTEQIADTGGWEYDAETEEVRWTDGTFDIHDVSSEFEATVENVISLYHPEDRNQLREAIQSCIDEGLPYEDEFRIKGEKGEVSWIQMNGEPVSEDGEIIKMRGAVQDVTDRKEREQSLRRNRELLSQTERISNTGGWEVDLRSGELRWTEGTYELHELPDSYEPTVENAVGFFHGDSEEEIQRAVERCRDEGEPYDKELRLLTAEDNLIWVRTLGEPVYEENEVVKLRGAIQDITERKEREREIKEQKDQIDFFNSLLRHDMLNSMTVIGGSSDILLQELPEDDERHELAERISKHSTEIVELTERVRSVLRRLTEDGETEMSPADITEVIEERVGSLKETYPEVTCTTEASDEVRVAADPFLNHVIDNILVNAVEHNDKEEPRVDVTVEEDEGTATIRVADNGPGVPDDEKESVFEQGTTGRSSGSVGFGLYYVEQMISEYGGEIHVEDNEPEGAVFVMKIPKAEKVLDGVETVAGGS